MYKQRSFGELIEYNNVYSNLADKLEIPTSFIDQTIEVVCKDLNINYDLIHVLLKIYDNSDEFSIEELENLSIDDILFYLKKTHRYYLYKKLPEIEESIIQLFDDKATADKLLLMFCFSFNEFKNKLVEHISFEEKQFFGYIDTLEKVDQNKITKEDLKNIFKDFTTEKFVNAHNDIEIELETFGKLLAEQKAKSNLPLPFKAFLNQIDNFQSDMQIHALIEDDVLLKKVLLLEQKCGMN